MADNLQFRSDPTTDFSTGTPVEPPKGGTAPSVEKPNLNDINENIIDDNGNTGERSVKSNELTIRSYPRRGSGSGENKHVMRISIYTQNLSKDPNMGIVDGNSFDKQYVAGANRYSNIDIQTGVLAIGAVRTGEAVTSIASSTLGARSSASQFINPTKAGGLQLASNLVGSAFDAAKTSFAFESALQFSKLDMTKNRVSTQYSAYIDLYMPESLNFINQQDFDAVSLTEALGSAGRFSQGQGITEVQLQAMQDLNITGERYRDFYLQKNRGYALNPQLEILYNGPKNREFVFTFKFTPRSAEEANDVEDIIRTLRYHSAPEYTRSQGSINSRYMIPPSQFGIEFLIENKRNKHLPRIAQCVLTNVDLNYAPSGRYATFTNGTPVEIQMQLTFTETVVLTKEDISIGGY